MPILATITTPSGGSPWGESRSLRLRTIGGDDEQPFTGGVSYGGGYDWVLLPGATGLDLPPLEPVIDTSPGLAGGWLREMTVGVRKVFLPLYVASSTDHADYLANRARLFSLLDYLAVSDMTDYDGTAELVAASAVGERYLRVVYAGGLEGDEGRDQSGRYWGKYGVNLAAPDPYWRATDETVLTFSSPAGEPFLSTDGAHPWPRRLTPSVSLADGGQTVTVGGTVPVWPVVEVVGPATSTVLSWAGPGDEATAVTLGAVGTGETLTLTTDPRRRNCEVNGAPAWNRVGTAPQFGRLQPGAQQVAVGVAGIDAASVVRIRFAAAHAAAW